MAHSPRLAGPAHASNPESAPSPSHARSRSVAALAVLTTLVGLLVSLPGRATSQVASSQGAVTRAPSTQDPSPQDPATQFASTQAAPAPDEPLPPDEAARTMVVPDGFQVTLFAGEPDVKQPIAMALDDRGRLWVAEAYNYPVHGQRPGDRIIILEDTDGDGRHDKRKVFYDKLNYVTGVEVGFGGVWVMSPPQFYFIPDRDGDDQPDGEPVVLLDGFGNHANSHNLANNFAWGPDGWLYGTHGRTNWSMIGKPGTPEDRRARFDGGVYRYHPVRHVWEPFADGMTNAWGLDWNDYGEAFVCNCVNPHLFHIIPGAHYEPWRNRKSSEYAYERIASIADHLHFVGRKTVQEGLGTPEEDEAGGGHAHCGTMVYLGDNWPAKYRNSIFMHNIHGKRINNDLPRRSGSGYVATHGPDLMRSRDSWFMGVSLIYGPDGGVYSADWSDTGECHSVRNTRRETGRVYKITYGPSKAEPVDISRKSNDELVQLHLHRNDWHVRHARRVLQERAAAGQDLGSTIAALRAIYNENPDVTRKLRALWTLHALSAAADEFLVAQLDQSDEHLRSWAIRLLCDDGQPPAAALAKFQQLAARGDSAFDRLHLASGMQRLSPADRWPIVEALARRGEDERDQNLPLMNWYAIEPLVADDLPRFIRLAGSSQLSPVRKFAARRAVELVEPRRALELLVAELGRAPSVNAEPKSSAPKTGDAKTGDAKTGEPNAVSAVSAVDAVRRDLLAGMHEGLKGRRRLPMPTGWSESYASLRASGSAEVREAALRLALIFDDPKALAAVLSEAGDRGLGADVRNRAIAALAAHKAEGAAALFLNLLDDPTVRRAALQGLAEFDAPQTAETILKKYGSFDVEARQDAIQTLTSRTKWAVALLDALDANQLPRGDISAFSARQLLNLRDPRIAARVQKSWGDLRSTPAEKAKLIARYQRQLTREQLAAADRSAGRAVFKTTCANCHRLFDAGGKIGPDITGAQRFNLTYLLENIIDPSAAVARDFQMQIVETDGGRTITGLVVAESDVSITIQTATEQIVVPVAEIANRSTSKASMMPDGLLDKLTPEQVRDLIAYLSGPGQVD